ncbi:MAG: haloalkane dehalogenase [Solirubrobacterales bacterium]
MTDYFRTPDERFEGLPDFPWEPRYTEWEELRLARIDEGEGEPVVLFHGEPTWSFLYRKVMPPLLDAGHRCIAPDYPGFGRSDKPTDFDWYSYDRFTESMVALLSELEVANATFVVQDWGGPIGMRIAAEHPEMCARLVVMDTGVFHGRQKMSDAWITFRNFVERTEDLPISMLVGGACAGEPSDEVLAAYDAPFPEAEAKAGARAFPLLVPTSPDDEGADAGMRTAEAMADSDRPVLMLWAAEDPILTPAIGQKMAENMGWPEPELIKDASHFLQEDQGEKIGERIAEWLDS